MSLKSPLSSPPPFYNPLKATRLWGHLLLKAERSHFILTLFQALCLEPCGVTSKSRTTAGVGMPSPPLTKALPFHTHRIDQRFAFSLFFKIGSNLFKSGLQLTMQLRITLNF